MEHVHERRARLAARVALRVDVGGEVGDDGGRVDLRDARPGEPGGGRGRARPVRSDLRRLRRGDGSRVELAQVDAPRLGLCERRRRLGVCQGLHLGGGARRVDGAGREQGALSPGECHDHGARDDTRRDRVAWLAALPSDGRRERCRRVADDARVVRRDDGAGRGLGVRRRALGRRGGARGGGAGAGLRRRVRVQCRDARVLERLHRGARGDGRHLGALVACGGRDAEGVRDRVVLVVHVLELQDDEARARGVRLADLELRERVRRLVLLGRGADERCLGRGSDALEVRDALVDEHGEALLVADAEDVVGLVRVHVLPARGWGEQGQRRGVAAASSPSLPAAPRQRAAT